ncbi:MAG TPA: gluconate 2-dehydrogenase subunit 3 family protein [Terriglobia bacterium]|nr:gluconate 2-dehydrogenase subunit 3 family protein [Terriglobia bacterium]
MSGPLDKNDRLTRRRALKKIAGTASAAVVLPILSNGAAPRAELSDATFPAIDGAASYVPKFFRADQMETISSLAEMIIPADDHSPGARAARVHEFIDTIAAESSPARKDSWINGLAAVDKMAIQRYKKKFAACDPIQQRELLITISAHEDQPTTPEEHFFATLKNATIEGYYTSAIGIHQELEYQGNTALGEFEGCALLPHRSDSK